MLKMSTASPLWVLSRFPAVDTTGVTSMAALMRVLVAGSAAATTDVEDVDGSPPVGAIGISGNDHHRN
jgi:hypothetical protein